MLEIDVEILDNRYKTGEFALPTYKTEGSAGMDIIAAIDEPVTIKAGETVLIPTGLKLAIRNPAYVGLLMPRSGLGHKKGLVLGNLTGVIDSDYSGQLMVSLWNRNAPVEQTAYRSWEEATHNWVTIQPGESIAQYLIVPVMQAALNIVDSLEPHGERGEGGFGSTDLERVINIFQTSANRLTISTNKADYDNQPLDWSWRIGDKGECVDGVFTRYFASNQLPEVKGVVRVAKIQHDGFNSGLSTLSFTPAGGCQIYAPGVQLNDPIYVLDNGACMTRKQIDAMVAAGSVKAYKE